MHVILLFIECKEALFLLIGDIFVFYFCIFNKKRTPTTLKIPIPNLISFHSITKIKFI